MDKGSQSFDLIAVAQSVVTASGYGYSESLSLQGFLGIGVEKNTHIKYHTKYQKKKKIQLLVLSLIETWAAAALIHYYLLSNAILNSGLHFWPCPAGGSRWT